MYRIPFILLSTILLFCIQTSAQESPNFDLHAGDDHVFVSSDNDQDRVIIIKKSSGQFNNLSYSGEFILSDNAKEVIKISPGGHLKLSRSSFGNTRKIEITSNNNGILTKDYYEGKTEVPFEPNGRQWLADILPEMVRETGIGAEHRVETIYRERGVNGLLGEIDNIDDVSHSVRNLYFTIAVDKISFPENDLRKFLSAMEMIKSNSTKGSLLREILYKNTLSQEATIDFLNTTSTLDYNTERGSTLRVLNEQLIQSHGVVEEYFSIIDDMSINSEKGNVLKHLVQTRKLESLTYHRMFRSISRFSSEREKGAVLLQMIDYLPDNQSVLSSFNETVSSMSSHYYILKGEILNALSNKHFGYTKSKDGTQKEIYKSLLKAALNTESNSQRGLTLRQINRAYIEDVELTRLYFEVLEDMDAELEQYNVLLDLIYRNKLSVNVSLKILNIVEDLISEDYQHAAGAVLRSFLNKIPQNEEVYYAFFECVDDMDQNSTIEEVLRLSLAKKEFNTNERILLKIIDNLDNIDVDIERAMLLERISPYVKKGKESAYAYKSAVKDLDLEYFQRRVKIDI